MYTVKSFCLVLAVTLLLVGAGFAQADIVNIVNPSFESPTPLTNENDETGLCATPNGWTWTRQDLTAAGMFNLNQTDGPGIHVSSIPDGLQAIWANRSSLHQVLSENLMANTTYTLTVYAGARDDLNMNHFGDSDPTVRLGYGSSYGENLLTAAASNCPIAAMGTWEQWTLTFETGANPAGLGQPLRVEINASSIQPLFDNMQLTASTVPEPNTLVLLATGLIGLLAYAWRKAK